MPEYIHITFIACEPGDVSPIANTLCGIKAMLGNYNLYVGNLNQINLTELEKMYSKPWSENSMFAYSDAMVGKKACKRCLEKEVLYNLGQVKLD